MEISHEKNSQLNYRDNGFCGRNGCGGTGTDGDSRIAVVNPSSDQTVLQIRSLDGRASAMIRTLTTAAHAPEKSRLAFHRYGESYFFAQLQVVGESTTLTAVKSNAERVEAQAASKPVVAFVNTF
jgi:hypothetical protein